MGVKPAVLAEHFARVCSNCADTQRAGRQEHDYFTQLRETRRPMGIEKGPILDRSRIGPVPNRR